MRTLVWRAIPRQLCLERLSDQLVVPEPVALEKQRLTLIGWIMSLVTLISLSHEPSTSSLSSDTSEDSFACPSLTASTSF